MIKIIETSTSEREEEFHQKYNEFKYYYNNTDMLMKDIWLKVGLTPTCSTGRRIREQLRHDGHDPFSRGQQIKHIAKSREIIPEVRIELREGGGIDETLRKHNLTLKEAMDGMDKTVTRSHRRKQGYEVMGKFIYRMGKYYVVQKSIRNISTNFGTYNSLSDAQRVRDYFSEYGWVKSKLDEVCAELGVERRIRN